MPTAALIQVADAVAELLEATVLAEGDGASIERTYVPVRELAEAEALYVAVTPDYGPAPAEARRQRGREYQINILVQHRVPLDLTTAADVKTWLDGRLLFLETLQSVLEDNYLHADGAGAPFPLDALIIRAEIQEAYGVEELHQQKLFAAWIQATYRTERAQA